jgi:quercetin dioxygenase-like cupin family protein
MAHKYFSNPQEKIVFSVEGPQPQSLFTKGQVKVIVVGLNAGQKIPVHAEGLSVFQFIEGQGIMIVDEERLSVAPGAVIVVEEGAPRGMEAETKLKFMAVRITESPH